MTDYHILVTVTVSATGVITGPTTGPKAQLAEVKSKAPVQKSAGLELSQTSIIVIVVVLALILLTAVVVIRVRQYAAKNRSAKSGKPAVETPIPLAPPGAIGSPVLRKMADGEEK